MEQDPRTDRPFDKPEEKTENTNDALAQAQEEAQSAKPEENHEDIEAKLKQTYERLLRVAADFENYKKRVEAERSEFVKFANEKLVRDLLPVLDNLKRAIETAKGNDANSAFLAGVQIVYKQFLKVLERFGVKPIEAVGKQFDPGVHEAMHMVETDEHEPGTIVEELAPGYTMSGRVLRPALVCVARKPEPTSPGIQIPEQVEEN
jgi:molecular chaperone GrpE